MQTQTKFKKKKKKKGKRVFLIPLQELLEKVASLSLPLAW